MWSLFGSTNQALGALTLLTITIYLRNRGTNYLPYFIPMVFMVVVTLTAMVIDLAKYWEAADMLLLFVAGSIFTLSVWLAVEGYLRLRAPVPEPVAGD